MKLDEIRSSAKHSLKSPYPSYHELAKKGALPPGFKDWELRDEYGNTVAHYAAVGGYLPTDFKHWEWPNNDGKTVAHFGATFCKLPKDFDKWDLKDYEGNTVREVYDDWKKYDEVNNH